MEVIAPIAHAVAGLLALVLAVLLLRAQSANRMNRWLAAILVAEGAFNATFALMFYLSPGSFEGEGISGAFVFGFFASFLASVLYLVFLSSLDTPLARPFRSRATHRLLYAFIGAVGLLYAVAFVRILRDPSIPDALGFLLFAPVFFGMLLSSAYGLAVAISAWRRAPQGSEGRKRAMAFVAAFGGRDLFLLIHLVGGPILGNILIGTGAGDPPAIVSDLVQSFLGLATIVFAVCLTYGILRTQLFDLDLRIKVGIRRSTVVTIGLVVVLGAAKVAELYLSRTLGFVAGGVAAGAMLVLAPRLNKIGDKVANTAMPQVQPTSDYIAYKKLEVYRAAVESAQETGGINEKDRASLDRLRAKLGLKAEDAAAVEREVVPA